MDWIVPFYRRQWTWMMDLDAGAMDRLAEARARLVVEAAPARDHPLRVLELGAGGGEAAVATARLGHEVWAVDIVPDRAADMRKHAASLAPASDAPRTGSLHVVEGDFHVVELDGPFDVIAYWDGFGVGDDADQRRLLARMAGWLAPDGMALVDVYSPWTWAAVAGWELPVGTARRRYDFDPDGNRMLDTWWSEQDDVDALTQSLRCYAPADLRLLLEDTGLQLDDVTPNGGLDADRRWLPEAPLERSISWRATLRPSPRTERTGSP